MTLSFVIGLVVLTHLAYQMLYKCRNGKNKASNNSLPDKFLNEDDGDTIVYHELLEIEIHFYKNKMHPISTLTWFKGDYNNVESILHHKINKGFAYTWHGIK